MRRHRFPELTDTQLTVDHVPTAVHNALYCLARGRKPGWPKTRKPLLCSGMRVGATTCQMAKYPRQESNNQQILRDVWQNPKEALQTALLLVTIRRRSIECFPAASASSYVDEVAVAGTAMSSVRTIFIIFLIYKFPEVVFRVLPCHNVVYLRWHNVIATSAKSSAQRSISERCIC